MEKSEGCRAMGADGTRCQGTFFPVIIGITLELKGTESREKVLVGRKKGSRKVGITDLGEI
jgi:hypothetical protein